MSASDITWTSGPPSSVARSFSMLGQLGFWVQLVLLIVVLVLGLYTMRVAGSQPGIGGLIGFLVLLLPVFTTYWCWRYAQIGRSMKSADTPPSPVSLRRSAWIGVWVGSVGSLLSLVSLFAVASALLVVMLANPQVGIQISPVAQGGNAYSVSAIDTVGLMALLLTLTAELVVVAISLRLVFAVSAAARADRSS